MALKLETATKAHSSETLCECHNEGIAMDYEKFLNHAWQFEFVPDPDAAVKAVCGILASRMDEASAREFTSRLPEPLTLDLLRGHQENPPNISVEDAATTLVQQFHISREQARELFASVTRFARDVAGREIFDKAAQHLSPDWSKLFTG
jgi:uncharacterized protein (DUF2267 family)